MSSAEPPKYLAVDFQHDFKKTPSLAELTRIKEKAESIGDVVKISTMVNSEDDIATLQQLLEQNVSNQSDPSIEPKSCNCSPSPGGEGWGEGELPPTPTVLAKTLAKPLCVIGMGALAQKTRVAFSTQGSCLTYGFLDASTAPGQMSAAELTTRLREALPAYRSR
nr:major capsid protein [Myoviridae environmental samples]